MGLENLSQLNINSFQNPKFLGLTSKGIQGGNQQPKVEGYNYQKGIQPAQQQYGGISQTIDGIERLEKEAGNIDVEQLFAQAYEEYNAQDNFGIDFKNLIQFQPDDGEVHPYNEHNLYVA